MDIEADLNTTKKLLDDTLPGGIVDSVVQDDSEEEVFFGNISSKEKNGKNAKFNRRRTIGVKESDRRRSFEVSKSSSHIKLLNERASLYRSQEPIVEESGFNEGIVMAEIETELDGSPEGASANLASENIGDAVDGSLRMEDSYLTSRQNRNHGSLAHERFRSDKDFSLSKFHSNNSFSMGKEREKDDAKCSKKDNLLLDDNMCLDISYSPLGHSDMDESSKIFSEDGYLGFPKPVIEDSFTTHLKVLDEECTPINKSLNVDETEDPQNDIIDSNVSRIDVLEYLTESEILPSDLSKESFSNYSFKSNDKKSLEGATFPANAPKNDTSITNSPDKLPQPVIQSDISTDESERDVEDSFFSNLASNNVSNVNSNSISGVEPFDVDSSNNIINGSFHSASSAFQRSKVVLVVGATKMDKSQIDDSNSEPSPTEQEPILFGDENKFFSSTESCKREPHVDDESESNVSMYNSSGLLEISLEMGERFLKNEKADASSRGSSITSSNLLDCSINTKMKIKKFQQKVETDEQEDELSEIEDLKEQGECHLDSNQQDWETSELENVDNEEGKNPLDILDVDNDQLFDDSLYSLGDNASGRLSTISNKICKTWEKKERKTRKNINANESSNENVNSTEDSFYSVLESLPNSKDASVQEQEEFDNTTDEMALYEMFGEHYDKVVEEMTGDEKKKLRRKLDSRTEQDHLQTEEKLKLELAVSSPPSPTVSTKCKGTSLTSESPNMKSRNFSSSPALPSSVSSCLKTSTISSSPSSSSLGAADNVPFSDNTSIFSKPQDIEPEIPTEPDYRHQPKSPGRSFSSDCLFKSPTHFRQPISPARSSSSESLFKSPTYLQPTTASLYKRVIPSPSPSKPIPWIPVSPHCNKSFIPVPVHTPTRTPLKATPQLAGATTRTPGSAAKAKLGSSRAMVSPSPLGTYLRDNKPPPLVEQVKAQSAVRDLESTLMEVENEAPETACSLPEARYYKPSLVKEHLSDATNKDYNIAQAYGQTNTLAKVTRHVGRMKLTGKRWDEELKSDQNSMMSPSRGQFGLVGKSVIKKTKRDSGTSDESMVDMSVLETVAVKKIGRKDVKDNY